MSALDEKIAFLKARLDEDERFAKRATEGPWTVDIHGNRYSIRSPWRQMIDDGGNEVPGGRTNNEVAAGFTYVDGAHDNVYFIARFDSARALAEIAAKRSIINMAEKVESMARVIGSEWGLTDDDVEGQDIIDEMLQVYAEHPDFQEGWRS